MRLLPDGLIATGNILIYTCDLCHAISSKSIARMTLSSIKTERSKRMKGLKHIRALTNRILINR